MTFQPLSSSPILTVWSKLALGCLLVLTFSPKSYSQQPGKKETIVRINEILAGTNCKADVSGDQLVLTFINESGQEVRTDKVMLVDLHEEPFFEDESSLLCIPCLKDAADCVTRTLKIQKIKRTYDRVSIPVGGEAQAKSLGKAFSHLIKIEGINGYKDVVQLD